MENEPATDGDRRRGPSGHGLASVAVLESLYCQSPIGLAVYDTQLRLVHLNAALARIYGAPVERIRGRRVTALFPVPDADRIAAPLRTVLDTGVPVLTTEDRIRTPADPEHERVWAVSSFRLTDPSGQILGAASAVADVTDHHTARKHLVMLNDASERIGSTLDVTRTAEELAQVAVPRLADLVAVDLLDGIALGEESPPGPVDGATLLRRIAVASVTEQAREASDPVGVLLTYPSSTPCARCLESGEPLLVPVLDRDSDWLAQDASRGTRLLAAGVHSLMAVPMRARAVTLGMTHFYRWRRPTPFTEDDLALARELVARAAVCVDNARRYTREHDDSLILQRGLLARGSMPEPNPVQTAHRYLPARSHTGFGGDWFDVIPLSGARVGLAIGDVAGRGIHAVSCAGRLRTAVQTLAGLDLSPDELLARVDDVASREAEAQAAAGEPVAVLGTTFQYAVYDPVTGRFSVASAGHLPPAVVRPGREPELLDLPAGPPLGLGGQPFEALDVDLPDGSVLALCTNGLLQDRHFALDSGLTRLLHALEQPHASLDELGQAVVGATLQSREPDDDAVLLLARTRTLPADRVATWDLTADPAVVAHARALAAGQLADWGLEEATFLTELIVSELVTNAIRYGRSPIRLRLIRYRKLICEVSDASSTSPHLRRAATTDEGGRGLFMIAHLADSWGTRYSPTGKTIWAEQSIATPERP